MLEKYSVHTDLALEEQERFVSDDVEISGVILEEECDDVNEMRTTKVMIRTENAAHVMGKPVGTYITMEIPNLPVPDPEYHAVVAEKLAKHIRELMHLKKTDYSVLVAGLGNRKVTPDALGPHVVDQLHVTRHVVREYGKYAMGKEHVCMVSTCIPGVMAQTGMETLDMIHGIVVETKPDFLIVVDALAARDSRRLNRTIQITDAGIYPGSGVGNHRNGITKQALGIPVIAVGVPTVVEAVTIINDAMEQLVEEHEKQDQLREKISPHLYGMFVTPKDIDDTIRIIATTISEGLNRLFS